MLWNSVFPNIQSTPLLPVGLHFVFSEDKRVWWNLSRKKQPEHLVYSTVQVWIQCSSTVPKAFGVLLDFCTCLSLMLMTHSSGIIVEGRGGLVKESLSYQGLLVKAAGMY